MKRLYVFYPKITWANDKILNAQDVQGTPQLYYSEGKKASTPTPAYAVGDGVLIMVDPDADNYLHWVRRYKGGVSEDLLGYQGPNPPKDEIHHYDFILFAGTAAPSWQFEHKRGFDLERFRKQFKPFAMGSFQAHR